jgi:hypothetical protein
LDSNLLLSHAHPPNLLNFLSIPSFPCLGRSLKVNGNSNVEMHIPTHLTCHFFLVVVVVFFFPLFIFSFSSFLLPSLLIPLSHYNHDEDDDGQERSYLTFLPNCNFKCYNTTSMQQVLMTTTKGVCSLFFPTCQ